MISRRPRLGLFLGVLFVILGAPGPAVILEPLVGNAGYRSFGQWPRPAGRGFALEEVLIGHVGLTLVFIIGVALVWNALRQMRGER